MLAITREYLVKRLGYAEENVVLLSNNHATKSDLEKYVEKWLSNRVDQGDSVFVYFSGHGAPNPKTGDAYLVPFDGDPAYIETTGYPLKRLYDNLAKTTRQGGRGPAGLLLLRRGGTLGAGAGKEPGRWGCRSRIHFCQEGQRWCSPPDPEKQVSSTYTQKSHGLLTYFFLKGLQGEGGSRRARGHRPSVELFAYVKPEVERVARREYNNDQVPQLLVRERC